MLQLSKLMSILSFLIVIYSIYGINSQEEKVAFYIGILVMSISIFLMSIGMLAITITNKKYSKKKNSDELEH